MTGTGELSVIVKAKELCDYVMTVTEKSPKRYRSTFTPRLQNLGMDVISDLYLANETFVGGENARGEYHNRLDLQRTAMTKLRLLAYLAEMALKHKAILPRQYQRIAEQATGTMELLGGWIKSDRNRFGYR